MKIERWTDIAEIIGIISIVGGLILVALEIRQANNIAKAQMVMDIASQANDFNRSTFNNADVADLVTIISEPGFDEITAAQKAMKSGVAWHFTNLF